MTNRSGSFALAVVAALALLVPAGAAHADSIAFVRGGDVWLATPDGSREHQVTSGQRFQDVTQADDGTMYATEPPGYLYRVERDGTVGPRMGTGHLLDPDVSPDGSKLAIWYLRSDGGRVTVIGTDGRGVGWDDQNGEYLTWLSNDMGLYSNGAGYLHTFVAGTPSSEHWVSRPEGRMYAPAITRALDKLVVVYQDWGPDVLDGPVGPYKVQWYSNNSTPPRSNPDSFGPPPESQQPTPRCSVTVGDTKPEHPSFSPDGSSIAWEMPDGVHVRPSMDLAGCTQPPGGFVIAGARSPDWGPADVPETIVNDTTAPGFSVETVGSTRLRRALKKGIRFKGSCDEPCVLTFRVRYKRRNVLKGRLSLPEGGERTVRRRFTKKGRRMLRRVRRARVTFIASAVDASGNRDAGRSKYTLKR